MKVVRMQLGDNDISFNMNSILSDCNGLSLQNGPRHSSAETCRCLFFRMTAPAGTINGVDFAIYNISFGERFGT
jgi:hypothetical protein